MTEPASPSRVRMAFLVLVHSDPDMAVRLCERLAPHRVFVHVDAKAVAFPADRLARLDHVTVVDGRRAIFWAGFAMVQATLALLRTAVAAGDFSHFVLLSGACYPIRPIEALERTFRQDPDVNYIQMVEVQPDSHLASLTARRWRMTPLLPWRLLAGRPRLAAIEAAGRRLYNKASRLVPRRFVREIGEQFVWFGSQWWALTDDSVRYILDIVARRPQLSQAFVSTFAPDEQFFQTIIASSPFAEKTSGPRDDRGDQTTYDAPLHIVHPSKDRIFGNGDNDFLLIQDSSKFFMRKVDSVCNRRLLDRVDAELLSSTN